MAHKYIVIYAFFPIEELTKLNPPNQEEFDRLMLERGSLLGDFLQVSDGEAIELVHTSFARLPRMPHFCFLHREQGELHIPVAVFVNKRVSDISDLEHGTILEESCAVELFPR